MSRKGTIKRVLALALALALALGGVAAVATPVYAQAGEVTAAGGETGSGTSVAAGEDADGAGAGVDGAERAGGENAAPGVTITIVEDEYGDTALRIPQGETVTDADLLYDVSAEDESGEAVAVAVADVGGLDVQNPQPKGTPGEPIPYLITCAAEGAENVTRECYVTLHAAEVTPLAAATLDLDALAGFDPNSITDTEIKAAFGNDFSYINLDYTITYEGSGPLTITGTGAYTIASNTTTEVILADGTSFGAGGMALLLGEESVTVTGGGEGVILNGGIVNENGNLTIEGRIGAINNASLAGIGAGSGDVVINGTVGNIEAGAYGIGSMAGNVSVSSGGSVGDITASGNGGIGIAAVSGNITIDGEIGNITAAADGISTGGGITIGGGVGDITADGEGISAMGNIIISGSVDSIESQFDGIRSTNGSVSVADGGSVGNITSDDMGISAGNNITISGSVDDITAGSEGISAGDTIIISGSVGGIEAAAGISADGDITIGGNVGDIEAGFSGIISMNGSVTVAGGGSVGDITAFNEGISAGDNITISGSVGDITANVGIITDGDITIGGNVGDIETQQYGIHTANGDVSVLSGGSVGDITASEPGGTGISAGNGDIEIAGTIGEIFAEKPLDAPSGTISPFAAVGDVTVNGTVGTALAAQAITIKLSYDTVASGGFSGVDARGWFANLPAGLAATASAAGAVASNPSFPGDTITITFGGTPAAASSAAFVITIPASVLASGQAIVVMANPDAKFAIAEPPTGTEYTVIEHFGTFTGSGTRSATVDAEHADFLRLEKDGAVVDPGHYTTREGSTTITLTEDHMSAHDNGTHRYRAVFAGGYADLTLIVDVATPPPDSSYTSGSDSSSSRSTSGSDSFSSSSAGGASHTGSAPQTGDTSVVGLWLALLGLSALGLGGVLVWCRTCKYKAKDVCLNYSTRQIDRNEEEQ